MLALDPGIRDIVHALRRSGFQTTDSGDGVSKPPDKRDLPFKHVFIRCGRAYGGDIAKQARGLRTFARKKLGLDVVTQGSGPGWYVQATYDPSNRIGVLMLAEDAQ